MTDNPHCREVSRKNSEYCSKGSKWQRYCFFTVETKLEERKIATKPENLTKAQLVVPEV